ncbi:hypothetical protein B9Z55_027650 [Caenorhabditis nigoni]|uniref:Resistance to inhibitors of cholinesterase protein 3 N-terminal domain-containing protein n=1 Tax=Caenorhabditis nigoni TaxID=1611254 RepID=A0A2G5SEP7_9PELO|nr:hypothetical protein B9Z55_027650 [Caenorhabditis nigoni]
MREFLLIFIFLLGLVNITAGTPTFLLDNRTNNEGFENSNATMISTNVVNSTISQIDPFVSSTSLPTTTDHSRKKFLSDPYFWLPISLMILLVLIWGYFRKEEEYVDWGENVYNGGGYPPNNYANSGAYAYSDFNFRHRIYTTVRTAFPGRGLGVYDLDTD